MMENNKEINNNEDINSTDAKEMIESNFEEALKKLLEENQDEWKEFDNIPEYIDRIVKNSSIEEDSDDATVKKDKETMDLFQKRVIDKLISDESKFKDRKIYKVLEKVEDELKKDIKIIRKSLRRQLDRLIGSDSYDPKDDETLDKILNKIIDPKKMVDLLVQIITKGTISKAKVKSVKDNKANIEFNLGFTLDGKLERFKVGVDIHK